MICFRMHVQEIGDINILLTKIYARIVGVLKILTFAPIISASGRFSSAKKYALIIYLKSILALGPLNGMTPPNRHWIWGNWIWYLTLLSHCVFWVCLNNVSHYVSWFFVLKIGIRGDYICHWIPYLSIFCLQLWHAGQLETRFLLWFLRHFVPEIKHDRIKNICRLGLA